MNEEAESPLLENNNGWILLLYSNKVSVTASKENVIEYINKNNLHNQCFFAICVENFQLRSKIILENISNKKLDKENSVKEARLIAYDPIYSINIRANNVIKMMQYQYDPKNEFDTPYRNNVINLDKVLSEERKITEKDELSKKSYELTNELTEKFREKFSNCRNNRTYPNWTMKEPIFAGIIAFAIIGYITNFEIKSGFFISIAIGFVIHLIIKSDFDKHAEDHETELEFLRIEFRKEMELLELEHDLIFDGNVKSPSFLYRDESIE